jgi:serine/threonine-protein kinase
VKVTDFGIARITDSSKTKTGLVLGTPSFMSPEQIAGKKVDGRSDLYSLGVMLFQMLTGVLPFRGDSMAELMYKIAQEEAPDVRIIRKDIPERLANVVALSLAKRPETRYQDGDQFAADLRSVLGDLSGLAPAQATPAIVPARPAPAAVAAVPDLDKTVPMAKVAQSYEATVAATVPMPRAPSYDATQQIAGADTDAFEKTAVIRPGAPGSPASGDGKTDLEP